MGQFCCSLDCPALPAVIQRRLFVTGTLHPAADNPVAGAGQPFFLQSLQLNDKYCIVKKRDIACIHIPLHPFHPLYLNHHVDLLLELLTGITR